MEVNHPSVWVFIKYILICTIYLVLNNFGYFNHCYYDLPNVMVAGKDVFAVLRCFAAVLVFWRARKVHGGLRRYKI